MKIIHKILLLPFVILLSGLSAMGQNQLNSKKFILLTYGLPDFGRQNAEAIIEIKWGIEFYPVAGCIVSQELKDSVKNENDKVEKLIEVKYGKNWSNDFDKAIEVEYKIEEQIDSLVKKQSFISSKEIVNPLPGAPFPMHPIDNKGNYFVTVSTYSTNWKEQKLYTLKVNYKTKTVKIINDYTSVK